MFKRIICSAAYRQQKARWTRRALYATTSSETAPDGLGKRLDGKVAVITGAASGIGEATARCFVAEGARVIIADIQDEAGNKLAEELGVNAQFIHCDVTKEEDISDSVGLAMYAYGRLDIMHNNAGVSGEDSSISELNLQDMQDLFKVNVYGVALGIKHASRVMKPLRSGCIINTSSAASVMSGFTPHYYTISKHAVVGLTKSSASELADYGIRVNSVSPAIVSTPLIGKLISTISDAGLMNSVASTPLIMDASEVAKSVLFLASDGCNISGHNLVIDYARTGTSTPKLYPRKKEHAQS